MKSFIFKFIIGIFGVIFIYERLTHKFVQPYQFNFVVSKPGSGKSTMYTKLAHYYLSRGYHVYGTDPVEVQIQNKKTRQTVTVAVKEIKVDKLYSYQFPENSIVLVDEMGSIFHSRNFKNFDKRNTAFFKRYRHDKLIIWGFSQSFDVDLVIRNVVSQFWLGEKYLRCWFIARRLVMKPVVVHPTGDSPSSIQDDFVEDPRLLRPILGGMKVTFIPRWVNNFDSYEIPESMRKERVNDFSQDPIPYQPKKIYHRRADSLTLAFNRKKAQAVVACKTSLLQLRKKVERLRKAG